LVFFTHYSPLKPTSQIALKIRELHGSTDFVDCQKAIARMPGRLPCAFLESQFSAHALFSGKENLRR
jgi:hypothetical protein